MQRNALAPENVVSCIFTATNDLNAEFPAVAARALGFDERAAAVRPRDRRAPLDAARDQGADPLPRRGGPRAQARLPGRGERAARRPAGRAVGAAVRRACGSRRRSAGTGARGTIGAWRSSSQSASGASPHIRWPAATPTRRRSCGWRATSRPIRRCRRCARRSSAPAATLNRYPDPSNSLLRAAPQRPLRSARLADRDRERLVRHPARRRRGAARAGRGDRVRVAVLLGLPAPQRRLGRARGDGGARRRTTATTCEAMLREITVATRLVIVCNPNNPTSTAIPLASIAELPRARCPARVRDRG